VDCAGIADPDCGVTPDWKHVASITWDSGSFWSLTGRWRFFGEVTYVDEVDQIVANNLGTQSYLDLNVVFRFADNHDVSLGVNNILDEEPPLLGGTLSSVGNTAQYHYDPLGRFLYATLNLRW
jgi:outer membrane receptor protein involved in Fe transport